jgi:hypothetical protein
LADLLLEFLSLVNILFMRGVLSGLFFLVSISVSFAQDKIHFIDGDVLECWIIEKTPHQVKYHFNVNANSPVITQKASRIQRIVYRNGVEEWVNRDVFRMGRRLAMNVGYSSDFSLESYFILQADYFITQNINFTARYYSLPWLASGLTAGFCHYFGQNRPGRIKFYSGALLGGLDGKWVMQVPVGFNYTSHAGFDIKLGISGFYVPEFNDEFNNIPGYGFVLPELTVGWRFRY